MGGISVVCEKRVNGSWICDVRVTGSGTSTSHLVAVTPADLERLGGDAESPEDLVRRAFAFLLARERQESILRRFPLASIAGYFPEFEETMRQ